MTPQEKAVELVNKFKNETDGIASYNYDDVNVQCALIAVDEVLQNVNLIAIDKEFYEEVKKEIKNL